jgi:ankyrin repeat protein
MLKYGFKPNHVDSEMGTSALHEAVRVNAENGDDSISLEERLKIVKCLASYGANPDLVNLKNEVSPILILNQEKIFIN